jgi:hypothetical protein
VRWLWFAAMCAGCGRVGFDGGAVEQRLRLDRVAPAEVLIDFPLLVILDDTRAELARMRPDASDLRFHDPDGSLLAHELEQAGARVIAWVRVPKLDAGTVVIARYGDPDAPAASGRAWSSDYEAVWHLGGDEPLDSTGRGHHGTAIGSRRAPALIGDGRDLDEDKQEGIEIPDATTLGFGAFTASGWAYERTPPSIFDAIITRQFADTNSNDLFAGIRDGEAYGAVKGPNPIELRGGTAGIGVWHHVATTADAATVRVFLDGVGVATAGSSAPFVHSAHPIYLGADRNSSDPGEIGPDDDFLGGLLDEVRLERVARTPAWIAYDITSMRDQLISYGPVEPVD